MRAKNNDTDADTLMSGTVTTDGSTSYAEKWSLHPGEARRGLI